MKKLWAAALAALFFASCAPVTLDANRIEIKGRIKASRMSKELKGMHAVYFVVQAGGDSRKKAIYQQEKKIRVDYLYELNGVDYIRGLDTFTGKWGMWKDDVWTGNAETDNYPKEFEIRFAYFPCWFERFGKKTIYTGDEPINGIDCYVLVTEDEKKNTEVFYIDKKTLLAVKWKISMAGGKKENFEYYYLGYRPLGKNFQYAGKVEGSVNGKKSIEMNIAAMETGLSFEPQFFNAYRIDIMDTADLEKKIKQAGKTSTKK